MLTLKITESLIALLTFFLAYLVVVTFAGCFSAWVAKKMGDSSAADSGYLTIDPFVHIDLIGLLSLFFFGIGWDKNIPVDASAIYSRNHVVRWLKICFAFWSRALAHFIIGTLAMTLLIIKFGNNARILILESMFTQPISPEKFNIYYPGHSSMSMTIGLVLISIVHVSVIFAIFDFLLKTFSLVITFLTERSSAYAHYYNFFTIFLYLLVIMIFIIPQFWWFILTVMTYWGNILASIIRQG